MLAHDPCSLKNMTTPFLCFATAFALFHIVVTTPVLFNVVRSYTLPATGAVPKFTGWSNVCGGMLSTNADVNTSTLDNWEKELVRDFDDGVSSLGRIAFATSTRSSAARAHFILGVKALTNFMYDFAAYEFARAKEADANYGMAYWGLALSKFQAIWNNEDVAYSRTQLTIASKHRATMNGGEVAYLDAALALNAMGGACKRECADGVFMAETCKRCRYETFDTKITDAAKQNPRDLLLQSYCILSNLAVGSLPGACTGKSFRDCPALIAARQTANESYVACPFFAATLHYGLHAHDYPDYATYESGLHFAVEYPKLINASVHSLHMPSHLWDRAGNFEAGAASNLASLIGARTFVSSGATSAMGVRAFEYNAGNVYHSLEYEQYELLMRCDLGSAGQLAGRMDFARQQSFVAGSKIWMNDPTADPSVWKSSFGEAAYGASAYAMWSYRMVARQTLWTWSFEALGALSAPAPWTHLMMTPYPLPWKGGSVTSSAMYAPQSEAGILGAISIVRLFSVPASSAPPPAGKLPWTSINCGLDGDGCAFALAQLAKHRIGQAVDAYASMDADYESYAMRIMIEQVDAMLERARGNHASALNHARRAKALQLKSNDMLRPTSTSVLFLPGDAFFGVFVLLASDGGDDLLQEAVEAFESFSPAGRPNHTVCLYGLTKALAALGEFDRAKEAADELLRAWDTSSPSFACKVAQDG